MNNETKQTDTVELRRGGEIVSSFPGAFGKSLSETRLTAILGYLIALKPKPFCHQFGITGTTESVWLELNEEHGRTDIRIESTNELAVIEAKVGAVDPSEQAEKYKADRRILLTPYLPTANQKNFGESNICAGKILPS